MHYPPRIWSLFAQGSHALCKQRQKSVYICNREYSAPSPPELRQHKALQKHTSCERVCVCRTEATGSTCTLPFWSLNNFILRTTVGCIQRLLMSTVGNILDSYRLAIPLLGGNKWNLRCVIHMLLLPVVYGLSYSEKARHWAQNRGYKA